MTTRLNRRRFLQSSALAGAGYFFTADALSAMRAADEPNGKLHFAGIGVGGKGASDISQAGHFGEVIALCDIDENTLNGKANEFPSAKKYFDFRKMLDEMGKQIDAVTVSTPDHTHAPACVMAMKMKKHVYCQKPLTHTVYEARQMREIAKQMGVATQMGNQGSAASGLRRAVELIQSGIIGPVKAAHVWTDRPAQYWKQAPDIVARPTGETEPPAWMHWEEFIGPAPMRPFAEREVTTTDRRTGEKKTSKRGWYHPGAWRGYWDFGTGALGDMACHTANMAFRALNLGSPISVVAEAIDLNNETYPSGAKITYEFAARGDMPPLTLTWYEGKKNGKKLLPDEELVNKAIAIDTNEKRKGRLVNSGSILVGEKGILYSPDDYGAEFFLSNEAELENLNKSKPEKLPINDKGDDGMKAEWVEAIKGGPAAYSSFDFAALFTETMLLGNIAIRLNGQKLEWDGPGMKFTNPTGANPFLHYDYRKGWTL